MSEIQNPSFFKRWRAIMYQTFGGVLFITFALSPVWLSMYINSMWPFFFEIPIFLLITAMMARKPKL